MKERLELNDDLYSSLFKMSEGNPGALHALMESVKEGGKIDPQSALGGFGVLLSLDAIGIYGSSIYILYNDQCNRNIRDMMMLLRAYQLGFLSKEKIRAIAEDQTRTIKLTKDEMEELDTKVCERLDRFMKKGE